MRYRASTEEPSHEKSGCTTYHRKLSGRSRCKTLCFVGKGPHDYDGRPRYGSPHSLKAFNRSCLMCAPNTRPHMAHRYTATYTIADITNTARSFHANVTGAAGALNATIVIAVLAATMKPSIRLGSIVCAPMLNRD